MVGWVGCLLLLGLSALHRGNLGMGDGRSLRNDLDRVGVALAGSAQVAEPHGLFDSELARDFQDVKPLRELVDCNQRHDGTRDNV